MSRNQPSPREHSEQAETDAASLRGGGGGPETQVQDSTLKSWSNTGDRRVNLPKICGKDDFGSHMLLKRPVFVKRGVEQQLDPWGEVGTVHDNMVRFPRVDLRGRRLHGGCGHERAGGLRTPEGVDPEERECVVPSYHANAGSDVLP